MTNYTITKTYEMPIYTDRRKSFYGKARIIETSSGETLLQSYDTIVCKIDEDGNFIKLWYDYSATTMRHINNFIDLYGISGGGKKWWDAL